MKIRPLLITGSVAAAMAVVVVWFLFDEHVLSPHQDLLVSSGMTLATEWLELKPETPMKTAGDWSELFIEVPGLLPHVNNFYNEHFLLADGARLEVEGYLSTGKGERIYFDEISVAGDWRRCYLVMSNSRLQWKQRNYRFFSVALRSNMVIKTGKAVWVSYDPRSFKSGVPNLEWLK